jgi:Uma2 family endonuclease
VEVADTSLKQDRTKGIYYARAGIAQYWIVDLNGERLIEFTDPSDDGYCSERAFTGEERLAIGALPQITFTAAQILA